jgi:hypothetical protein
MPRKVATILIVAILIVGLSSQLFLARSPNIHTLLESRLSRSDLARVMELMKASMQGPNEVSFELHQEFWSIIDRNGSVSDLEIESYFEQWQEMTLTYQRLFWADALESLRTSRECKSTVRLAMEKKKLLESKSFERRFQDNDEFIKNIALKEPIDDFSGQKRILTEADIIETMHRIDDSVRRVKILMSREFQESK